MASDLFNEISAPLAAVYASWARVNPARADTEPTRMMEPPPAFWRCGMPCLVTQKTLLRLMAMTRSHCTPSVSSTERSLSFHRTPALLYRTWSEPKRFTPASTIRLTSSSTATSPTAANAWPPAFSTSATVSSAAALLMSHTTTRAPSAAKRTAASRPIPMPAPVISAVLPVSLSGILDSLEEPHELPVGDGLIEGLLFETSVVEVVLDHGLAEGLARQLRALQLVE